MGKSELEQRADQLAERFAETTAKINGIMQRAKQVQDLATRLEQVESSILKVVACCEPFAEQWNLFLNQYENEFGKSPRPGAENNLTALVKLVDCRDLAAALSELKAATDVAKNQALSLIPDGATVTQPEPDHA